MGAFHACGVRFRSCECEPSRSFACGDATLMLRIEPPHGFLVLQMFYKPFTLCWLHATQVTDEPAPHRPSLPSP